MNIAPRILIVAAGIAAAVGALRAEIASVYEENFNSVAPALEFLNEAQQGADGSGVSGKPGDRAYVAAYDPEKGGPTPGAVIPDLVLPPEMRQCTIIVWYKPEREVREPDTLFHIGHFYLLGARNGGWTMRLPQWVTTGPNGSIVKWSQPGEWIFYALAWDLDLRAAKVFQGTATDYAAPSHEMGTPDIKEPIGTGGPAIIGNDWSDKWRGPSNRPFCGSIDNIRIYGEALEEQEIEAIRAADIENGRPKFSPSPTTPP